MRTDSPAAGSSSDPGWYSILATLLLAFTFFPGVVLLWASRTWSRTDKLTGTLVLPAIAIAGVAISVLVGSGIPWGNGGFSPLASGFLVALVIAPIVTTPYLLVRARRSRARTQP